MTNLDRYLEVCRKLRNRYQREDGAVIISVGGKYSRYAYLEDLAAVKYLGCDPRKVIRA